MEWLPKLYQQHKNWPGLVKWVFVEAADLVYRNISPDIVTNDGLSTDGTTEYLEKLANEDSRVVHIRHGITSHPTDPAMGKCQARQRYLEVAEELAPDFLIAIDGDEFYTLDDQRRVVEYLQNIKGHYRAVSLRIRHPWLSPDMKRKNVLLFKYEVIGGFWDMAHCHWWVWEPGLRYDGNHNCPTDIWGTPLNKDILYLHKDTSGPQCIHMAFSSTLKARRAKHEYYIARGEGKADRRIRYVQSRRAWEYWDFDRPWLPMKARVVEYTGPIPEVFERVDHND